MPRTEVVFYREKSGAVPVLEWLHELRKSDRRAYARCLGRIKRLADEGHELRRPVCDFLRDGIYELRTRRGHVQLRLLYFFLGRNRAVLAAGMFKKGKVPEIIIERAIRRKAAIERDYARHSYEGELDDG